jgi:hypothetical protein
MKITELLRYLDNGYFIDRSRQIEAATLIRQLQKSNQSLMDGMVKYAEEVVALRRDLSEATRGQK